MRTRPVVIVASVALAISAVVYHQMGPTAPITQAVMAGTASQAPTGKAVTAAQASTMHIPQAAALHPTGDIKRPYRHEQNMWTIDQESYAELVRMRQAGNLMADYILNNAAEFEHVHIQHEDVAYAKEFGELADEAARGNVEAAIKAGDFLSCETDIYGQSYDRMQAARQMYRIAAEHGRHEGYLGIAKTYAPEYALPGAPIVTAEQVEQLRAEQLAHYKIAANQGSPEARAFVHAHEGSQGAELRHQATGEATPHAASASR